MKNFILAALATLSACSGAQSSAKSVENNFRASASSQSIEGQAATIEPGTARFLIFGESHHRVEENHRFASSLFSHLSHAKGFRVIVLESSWRIGDVFARYEAGDDAALESPEMAMFANAFRSRWLVEMFTTAREHNRSNPHDPIIVTGVQPESPVSDLREVEGFLSRSTWSGASSLVAKVRENCSLPASLATDIAFAVMAVQGRQVRGAFLIPDQYKACNAAISKLDERVTQALDESPTPVPDAWRVRASMLGLANVFGVLQPNIDAIVSGGDVTNHARSIYTDGDANRYKLFLELERNLFPRKKAFLWMHNWHAAKLSAEMEPVGPGVPAKGAISIGTVLTASHGEETLVVGSVAYDPTFTYPAGPFVEGELNTLAVGAPKVFDLRKAGRPALFHETHWLYGDSDGSYGKNVKLCDQFDIVAFYPTLTRLR